MTQHRAVQHCSSARDWSSYQKDVYAKDCRRAVDFRRVGMFRGAIGVVSGRGSPLANTAESTTTGFETIRSTVDLNAANLRLLELQAAAVETQARALEKKRQQEMSERAATVGILRDAANAPHDPTLDDLAIWVDAGGDPNIAIKYMLDHQTPPAIR
jgi:hypothetical protein